jgi:hypothetical protein
MHYIADLDNPLINMLNLKYTVDCGSHKIIKRNGYVPRAHIVHRAVNKDDKEVLDHMMGNDFDPLTMVVLSGRSKAPKITIQDARGDPKDTCKILSYDYDEIVVDAKLDTSGFLVMSEINYPGWQVFVNGVKQTPLTGNYLFRIVPLDAGRYNVRFVFNPFSFKAGRIVSTVSLLMILITLFVFGRRRAPGREKPSRSSQN